MSSTIESISRRTGLPIIETQDGDAIIYANPVTYLKNPDEALAEAWSDALGLLEDYEPVGLKHSSSISRPWFVMRPKIAGVLAEKSVAGIRKYVAANGWGRDKEHVIECVIAAMCSTISDDLRAFLLQVVDKLTREVAKEKEETHEREEGPTEP